MSALAALGALGVALTFARREAAADGAHKPAASVAVVASQKSAAVVAAAAASPASPSPALPSLSALPRFVGALHALARGERSQPVRALWYGDSHTAADFYPGAVRAALARRFGSGGPGFLRLGAMVRHDLASFGHPSGFVLEPKPPARRKPMGDGVFGLGGMRVFPEQAAARLSVRLQPRALRGKARYRLLFELPQHSSFMIAAGDSSTLISSAAQGTRVPGSPILRFDLEADPQEAFTLETLSGRPRFFGLVVEGSEPGVVIDTLGIDGARIATALAWAEAPFIAEVAARSPDLFVIAYGTNEAFDELRVDKYDGELSELVGRLRRAAPMAECLVVGPPDALLPSGEAAPRVAQIAAVYQRTAARLGCAFVSLQTLMGGAGSYATWRRADPPLAAADRIHYTQAGYRRLGELVAGAVFGPEFGVPVVNSR